MSFRVTSARNGKNGSAVAAAKAIKLRRIQMIFFKKYFQSNIYQETLQTRKGK
jgi:hypothetical protein